MSDQAGGGDKPDTRIQRVGLWVALAYDFVGVMIGGAAVGWVADTWLGWSPYGVALGTVLGLSGGLFRLTRSAQRLSTHRDQ